MLSLSKSICLCSALLLVLANMLTTRYSPFSNPNKSSTSRPHFLISNTSSILLSRLTSREKGFVASLAVGSEPIDQLLYMDTGSSLLWIYCDPCELHAPHPLFDPKRSASFQKEDCIGSKICQEMGNIILKYNKRRKHYQYTLRYGKGSSEGHLARETFKFGASSEAMENIAFGCNKVSNLKHVNGVLGLGANRLSILSQRRASRLSYCFGNLSDPSYPYSFLAIGDEIKLSGAKTPLMVEGKYYVNLESIRIGGKLLDVDPLVFKRNSADYTGGMVVDTGSTVTYFPRVVVNKFESEVIALIGDHAVTRNYSILEQGYTRLCYNGVLTRDLQRFPKLHLTFEGGAVMELTAENIFKHYGDDVFCLAILPSELKHFSFSILGSVMQQFMYVGIDLHAKEFAFQNVDCALVKDI